MEEEEGNLRRPTWIPIAPSPRRLIIRPIRPLASRPDTKYVPGGEKGNSSSYFSSSPPSYRAFHPPPPEMFRLETQNASKRRTETTMTEAVVYRENRLIHLCRSHQWSAVLERCKSHPEEAVPQKLASHDMNRFHLHSQKRVATYGNPTARNTVDMTFKSQTKASSEKDQLDLCHDTALGIACACDRINTEELYSVISCLVSVCPQQIHASQLVHGHTPLRDAIRNRNCTPQVLRLLLSSSDCTGYNNKLAAPFMEDRDGLLPVDHLIMGIQLGTPNQLLDLLREFNGPLISCEGVSPLIRLLTLGTSFGFKQQQLSTPCSIDSSPWRTRSSQAADFDDLSRLSRVLDCAKYLLTEKPMLISTSSKATGCSPLHVALRNYGNFAPLVKELLVHDVHNKMVQLRNHYGDLPLHVATSVGVPIEVLRLILQRTIESTPTCGDCAPHPLAWSTNRSGYTPVDLEWVRHIESGKGFYSARSFYPLDAAGVRKHCRKQDEYYKELLEEAVKKVIKADRGIADASQPGQKDEFLALASIREEESKAKFGMLIDRLELLVKAASSENVFPQSKQESRNPAGRPRYILHSAAALCQPRGPSLPLPIFQLFLWLHQDQLKQLDDCNRLPLHYALMQCPPSMCRTSDNTGNDWTLVVQTLLKHAPWSVMATDRMGRLPLHTALDHAISSSSIVPKEFQKIEPMSANHQQSEVIQSLVNCYPDSVDSRDPKTNLFPFMLAAANPNIQLDTIFHLLRRSPSRCCNSA